MIDWLTKQISKYKLPVTNNNKVIKKSEQAALLRAYGSYLTIKRI